MATTHRVRVLQFTLAMLATQCLGADGGCGGGPDYGKVTDIKITYKSVTFAGRYPTNRTHELGTPELLGVSESYTWNDGSVAVGEIIGLAPRELMLLSQSSLGVPRPSADARFATAIPGKSAKVAWQVNHARIFDHGACRSFFPFFDKGTTPGLFSTVRDGLNTAIFKEIKDGGVGSASEVFSIYQAMYSKMQVVHAGDIAVSDGVTFDQHINGTTPQLVKDVNIKIGGRFRVPTS